MNRKISICIVAVLLVFAVMGSAYKTEEQPSSVSPKAITYDVEKVFFGNNFAVGYVYSVFYSTDHSGGYDVITIPVHKVRADSDPSKTLVDNGDDLIKFQLGEDYRQYELHYPLDEIIPLGLSELKPGADERVGIAKIEGDVLTINYSGNPDNVKVIVFSKENSGKDLFDETHFLGEAFVANEREWKFVFDAGKPLPNMIMALVVYKDPREMEQYEKVHGRKYLALEIKPVASLQKSGR